MTRIRRPERVVVDVVIRSAACANCGASASTTVEAVEDDDTGAEVIEADRPPRPRLDAEWRVVWTLPSGSVMHLACASEADAEAEAERRMSIGSLKSVATVETRLVTEWRAATPAPAGRNGDRTVRS